MNNYTDDIVTCVTCVPASDTPLLFSEQLSTSLPQLVLWTSLISGCFHLLSNACFFISSLLISFIPPATGGKTGLYFCWRRKSSIEVEWEVCRQSDRERWRCSFGLVYLINSALMLPLETLHMISSCMHRQYTQTQAHITFLSQYALKSFIYNSCYPANVKLYVLFSFCIFLSPKKLHYTGYTIENNLFGLFVVVKVKATIIYFLFLKSLL